MAENAAVVRRVANRGADVATRLDPGEARGERRGRAARGAAGRAADVPRIVGRAVNRIVALPVGQHHRHVALAEQRHARIDHALRQHGGRLRDVVLHRRQAPGGGRARDLKALLDGHRHAVQRPEALPLLQRGVGGFRALARLLAVHPDDRVELRIVCLDAAEEVIEQFERAQLLAADERGKLGRGLVVQLIHRDCPEGRDCDSSAAAPAATIAPVTVSPPGRQIHDKSTTLFCPHDRRALTPRWGAT